MNQRMPNATTGSDPPRSTRCFRTSLRLPPLFGPSTSTLRQPTGSPQAKPPSSNVADVRGEPPRSPPCVLQSYYWKTCFARCGETSRFTWFAKAHYFVALPPADEQHAVSLLRSGAGVDAKSSVKRIAV